MGAAHSPRIEPAGRLWPVHYLIGRDPSKWPTNVPTYGRVLYHSVYPGIDLVFYGNENHLEYDFTVQPGADPRAIRLEMGGTARIEVEPGGDLVLETGAGVKRSGVDCDGFVAAQVGLIGVWKSGRKIIPHIASSCAACPQSGTQHSCRDW
jgi:hypothetical protein